MDRKKKNIIPHNMNNTQQRLINPKRLHKWSTPFTVCYAFFSNQSFKAK